MKKSFIVIALGAATYASAVETVVANEYAAVPYSPAQGLNTIIRDAGNPRTAQLLIGPSQLTGIGVGDLITGVSFRLYNGITGTYTGASWTSYDIRLGAGVDPSLGSTTFALNFTGSTTLVQTGALTMTGFTQTNTGSTPNAWNDMIVFTTPHIYTGGALTLEFRHTGSGITNPANAFLESVATTAPGYVANNYRSYTATGNAATVGGLNTFTMVRITSVPEPATMCALGGGLAALLARRRRRKA